MKISLALFFFSFYLHFHTQLDRKIQTINFVNSIEPTGIFVFLDKVESEACVTATERVVAHFSIVRWCVYCFLPGGLGRFQGPRSPGNEAASTSQSALRMTS